VLPLMIANMSAFALARYWRYTPIYEALLEQDGIELPHGTGPPGMPNGIPPGAAELTEDDATA